MDHETIFDISQNSNGQTGYLTLRYFSWYVLNRNYSRSYIQAESMSYFNPKQSKTNTLKCFKILTWVYDRSVVQRLRWQNLAELCVSHTEGLRPALLGYRSSINVVRYRTTFHCHGLKLDDKNNQICGFWWQLGRFMVLRKAIEGKKKRVEKGCFYEIDFASWRVLDAGDGRSVQKGQIAEQKCRRLTDSMSPACYPESMPVHCHGFRPFRPC